MIYDMIYLLTAIR